MTRYTERFADSLAVLFEDHGETLSFKPHGSSARDVTGIVSAERTIEDRETGVATSRQIDVLVGRDDDDAGIATIRLRDAIQHGGEWYGFTGVILEEDAAAWLIRFERSID
ncbi:MAG: hypothetical protein KY476_10820, partial [Planctomycetes bacterium]|nr:hypothetical protein [Planctomycetota bacterium]